MVGLSTPWHCVRVTGSMRDDMVVWLALENFNGISFWREVQILEAELRVHSDAVGALGFGVYFRGHWCAKCWPKALRCRSVTAEFTFLELFPLVVAVHIWADHFCNSTICF